MTIHNPNNLPTIDYRKVKPLQGNLKDLTETNATKLKRVLEKRGFKQPLNLWKRDDEFYLLDGHQRQRVLQKYDLSDNGNYEVPYLVTEADNEQDAKQQILEISSQYGTMTYEGWDEFTADLPDAEFDTNFDILPLLGSRDEPEVEEDEAPEVDEGGGCLKCPRHCLPVGEAQTDVRG